MTGSIVRRRNPILEEAAEVYLRRREYLLVHIAYIAVTAILTVLLWPSRGYMYFFRTESIPSIFQAVVVIQVIAATAVNLYIGLDRLAESQIIRYSEWLERTQIPIAVLAGGKLAAASSHALMLVVVGIPFAVVAAGPSGAPIGAVFASEAIVLLSALAARFVGMFISHIGESSYVVRVIGAWIYVALVMIATVQIYQPLNPIYAVIRQHPAEPLAAGSDPAQAFLASALPLSILVVVLAALFWISLARHRSARRKHE